MIRISGLRSFLMFCYQPKAINEKEYGIKDLAHIIEVKSGGRPVCCDAIGLRSRLGYDVFSMRTKGYDSSIIADYEAFNKLLEQFIAHPRFGMYLSNLTPEDVFESSGVRILPLDAIRQEIQELAPGALLFRHGYMPFASSIGGNVICFHAPTSRVVWADHDSFDVDYITFKDSNTGKYHTVSFAPEHIEKALINLADDFESFLVDLLHDRLEKRLDALD